MYISQLWLKRLLCFVRLFLCGQWQLSSFFTHFIPNEGIAPWVLICLMSYKTSTSLELDLILDSTNCVLIHYTFLYKFCSYTSWLSKLPLGSVICLVAGPALTRYSLPFFCEEKGTGSWRANHPAQLPAHLLLVLLSAKNSAPEKLSGLIRIFEGSCWRNSEERI